MRRTEKNGSAAIRLNVFSFGHMCEFDIKFISIFPCIQTSNSQFYSFCFYFIEIFSLRSFFVPSDVGWNTITRATHSLRLLLLLQFVSVGPNYDYCRQRQRWQLMWNVWRCDVYMSSFFFVYRIYVPLLYMCVCQEKIL